MKSNKNKKKSNKKKSKSTTLIPEPLIPGIGKKKSGHLLGEIDTQDDSQTKFRDDVKMCPHCEKYILKLSFMMHEMHCQKVQGNNANAKQIKSEKPATTKASKNTKVKKNPVEDAKTDDFDELLEMFQKSNDVCNFKGCKTLTKTLGQNCDFCPNRFCLKHSLAEVRY